MNLLSSMLFILSFIYSITHSFSVLIPIFYRITVFNIMLLFVIKQDDLVLDMTNETRSMIKIQYHLLSKKSSYRCWHCWWRWDVGVYGHFRHQLLLCAPEFAVTKLPMNLSFLFFLSCDLTMNNKPYIQNEKCFHLKCVILDTH